MEMTAVVAGENGQGLEGGGTGSSENTAAAAAAAAERAERYPAGNSSAAGAVSNFVNTIVGAGIIGLPFALAEVRSIGCLSLVFPPLQHVEVVLLLQALIASALTILIHMVISCSCRVHASESHTALNGQRPRKSRAQRAGYSF